MGPPPPKRQHPRGPEGRQKQNPRAGFRCVKHAVNLSVRGPVFKNESEVVAVRYARTTTRRGLLFPEKNRIVGDVGPPF